jgi:hypothetical protein
MRVLSSFLMFTILAAGLFATETVDSKSNALGEECPELLLEEEMVQGEPITWESLHGKVVLFLFYQRECEGSERYAMPRIQKLHEKYTGSGCWLVFVINTAFDKDIYPHLADVGETRKHLKRMDWTMPVARDLDEQSNALFTIDDQSGTPQAVVMDEHGVVRAHEWYSEKEEMDRVEAMFEALAAGMNCHCVRMPREVRESCKAAREAFRDGNYVDAYDKADTITRSYGYDEKDKADAEYLKKFIDDTAATRIERITRHYDRNPEEALVRADEVIDDFNGVTGVKDFATAVEKWRSSDHLANFRTGQKDLAKIEAEISKAGVDVSEERRKDLVDRLTAIADRTGKTVVAESARQHIDRLTAASAASGQDAVSSSRAERRGGGSSAGDNRVGASNPDSGAKVGTGRSGGEASKVGASKPSEGAGTSSETSRHRRVREAR